MVDKKHVDQGFLLFSFHATGVDHLSGNGVTQTIDIISLWDTNRQEIEQFIELANRFHPTLKFTAEISDKEATFLDTIVYKGARLFTRAAYGGSES